MQLKQDYSKPEPGYRQYVPGKSKRLFREPVVSKQFRQRLSKKPRQYIPLTQHRMHNADPNSQYSRNQ